MRKKSKKSIGVIFVISSGRVSTEDRKRCNPKCQFLKIVHEKYKAGFAGYRDHVVARKCFLDPANPVDLKPVKKRIKTDDDKAEQVANRSKMCLDIEFKLSSMLHEARFRRAMDGIGM